MIRDSPISAKPHLSFVIPTPSARLARAFRIGNPMSAGSHIYRIGVYMTLHETVSAGLAAMAGHLIGLHHHFGRATNEAKRFQMAVGGAVAAFTGVAALSGVKHLLDHGGELLRIQNQMAAGGWTQAEVAKATAQAWALTAKHQSVSVEKIMEMQKEMAPVLGDRDMAMKKAEYMVGMEVAMQGILGQDRAAQFTKQIRDAIRAGELAGEALRPERFQAYLDSMIKVLNAFGGTVTPTDFFMATKYGRASALNWSDEFRERILPTIIQELGASSTGTAFMSMYQALIGGTIHKRNLQMFDDLGLVNKAKIRDEDITPEGRIKRMSPGAITDSHTFMSNPYKWVHETLVPAIIRKGIISEADMDKVRAGIIKGDPEAEATRKKLTETIALMFGNRTAQGMVDLLALQPLKIERDARLIGTAESTEQSVKRFQEKDYLMAIKAVETQWSNLMTAIASPNMETATTAAIGLSKALGGLAQTMAQSPGLAQGALLGFGSLAVGLIAVGIPILLYAMLGGIGLIAAGLVSALVFAVGAALMNLGGFGTLVGTITSWIGQLFTGIGEAVTSFGANMLVHLGTVREALGSLLEAPINLIKIAIDEVKGALEVGLGTAMQRIATAIGNGLLEIPGLLAGAIAGVVQGIASAIGGALSGIAGFIGRSLGFGGAPAAPGAPSGGAAPAAPPAQPQSFTPPPARSPVIQTNLDVNLDGYQIARNVVRHVVSDGDHVNGPATYDGIMAPTPVDLVEA